MMEMWLKGQCEYPKELAGLAGLEAVNEQLKQEFSEGRILDMYVLGIGSKAFSG